MNSVDGAAALGPGWLNLYGHRENLIDGSRVLVKVLAEYFAAILIPTDFKYGGCTADLYNIGWALDGGEVNVYTYLCSSLV